MFAVIRPAFYGVVLIGLAALTGCSQVATGPGASRGARVLRVEIGELPKNLNPLYTNTTFENFLAGLVFNQLITIDDHGNEVPDLAIAVPTLKNGGISADGKTITYHLRNAVKWHDGAPFTSRDVRFSWQAVMNPRNNVISRRGYDEVATVATPDDRTVIFHLKEPFAPFVDTVFSDSDEPYYIVPAHLLAKYPDLNNVPFNADPIGTGPFRFERWTRGDHASYVANDAYFKGRPKLRAINVRFVIDDATQQSDLRSGEADLLIQITPNAVRDLRGQPGIATQLIAAPYYTALAMNLAHAPLNNVRIRRAIAASIDRAALIAHDTYSLAQPATEDLSTWYRWAYAPNVARHDYNPARAAALFDAAGAKRGPDGIRTVNGKRLEFSLVYETGNQTYAQLGVELQSQLHAAGIDVSIKRFEVAQLYAAPAAGGILTGGKYDLAISPWIAGADPDDSQQWLCSSRPPRGYNIEMFCNAQMDAAEERALRQADRPARTAAYHRTQEILADQVPALFLFYTPRLYASRSSLRGFSPNGIEESWNAQDWSLDATP